MPTWFMLYVLVGSGALGAASVLVVPRLRAATRAWRAARAEARKNRPRRREVLYERSIALAEEIQTYGRENLDLEMELLGIVLAHSTYQVSPKHGYPDIRRRCLKRAADVVASHRFDKWWRTPEPRPTRHMWQLINELHDELEGRARRS